MENNFFSEKPEEVGALTNKRIFQAVGLRDQSSVDICGPNSENDYLFPSAVAIAMALSKDARLLMDHARTAIAIKMLWQEIRQGLHVLGFPKIFGF